MSKLKIEIEDSTPTWQELASGEVIAVVDGTSSAAQIIPKITLTFSSDEGDLPDVDPGVNPTRPRIRITEDPGGSDEQATYYLMEEKSGTVRWSKDFPTLSGRAYAGILDDFRPLTYTWQSDATCSQIAAQVAHRDFDGQAGDTVGIDWQASIDAVIPGGRYEVNRKGRREIIKELAESCGAMLRTSLDGLRLEVIDKPKRGDLPASAHAYTNPWTLGHKRERIDDPRNAVRVLGLLPEYDQAGQATIEVDVAPRTLEADGTSNVTAYATVLDANGNPVKHEQIEEAIDAGSNTLIPVSGCYGGSGPDGYPIVWLNTGTQASPVKGTRVTPTTFDADTITVPDNSTDLFVVSYTRATEVAWNVSDFADTVEGEEQTSTSRLDVSTTNNIGRVVGVYRATDTRRIGTNYFTGGSFTANTTAITLGISPGPSGTDLIIDYEIYNGSPLGLSLSPTSSLCDPDGIAQTTIGVGSAAGTAVVEAQALGSVGEALLSLTGSDIAGLSLSVDPGVLRAAQEGLFGETNITGEVSTLVSGTDPNGQWYFDVANDVFFCSPEGISVAGLQPASCWWQGDRIYIAPQLGQIYSNGASIAVNYTTKDDATIPDSTADVVATVTKSDGTAVSDNTPVLFSLEAGGNNASLSSNRELTSSGEAAVTLTAGGVGEFWVIAKCGPLAQRVKVQVKLDPSDLVTRQKIEAQQSYLSDLSAFLEGEEDGEKVPEPDRQNAVTGLVTGCRYLVGCESEPLANTDYTIFDGDGAGDSGTTDGDGKMCFSLFPGEYTIEANDIERPFPVAPVP